MSMVRRGVAGARWRTHRDALTSRPRVERLLDAARAPASPRELAREDAAVDLFHRARLARDAGVVPAAATRSVRTGLKAAAASLGAVVALSSGVAFATTGHVPFSGVLRQIPGVPGGGSGDGGAGTPGGGAPHDRSATERGHTSDGHGGRHHAPSSYPDHPVHPSHPAHPTQAATDPTTPAGPPSTHPAKPTKPVHPTGPVKPTRPTHPPRPTHSPTPHPSRPTATSRPHPTR